MSCMRALALALAGALLAALAFMCIDAEPFCLFGMEAPEEPELSELSELSALPRAPQVMRALSAAAHSLRACSHHIARLMRALARFFALVVALRIGCAVRKALPRLRAQLLLFYLSRPEAAPPHAPGT
ncbi:MAG: hypothetical protein ACI4L8_01810 [Candidatus Fimadaptatus sp.]